MTRKEHLDQPMGPFGIEEEPLALTDLFLGLIAIALWALVCLAVIALAVLT